MKTGKGYTWICADNCYATYDDAVNALVDDIIEHKGVEDNAANREEAYNDIVDDDFVQISQCDVCGKYELDIADHVCSHD